MYAQVTLIFILKDVTHLQNAVFSFVFSFVKGSNGQYHSSSESHQLIKKSSSKNSYSPNFSRCLENLAVWQKKRMTKNGALRTYALQSLSIQNNTKQPTTKKWRNKAQNLTRNSLRLRFLKKTSMTKSLLLYQVLQFE